MQTVAAEKELYQACEIIFGPELNISREFLEYLQLSGIKSAYRKRAMETHPDRLARQNLDITKHNELFLAVQGAYENLIQYLDAREKGYRLPEGPRQQPFRPQPRQQQAGRPAYSEAKPRPRPRPQHKSRPFYKAQSSGPAQERPKSSQQQARPNGFWDIEQLYSGPIPNRRLMLGHFLYYSGIINWRTIIQALIWQRMERPRIGELGQRFGMLSEEDILHILRNRPTMKPFGQTALDMGLLSEPQLRMLIFHQKRLQRKFGEFFLEKNILAPEELRELLLRYQEHNAAIAARFTHGRSRF